jgi:hypothetical protein
MLVEGEPASDGARINPEEISHLLGGVPFEDALDAQASTILNNIGGTGSSHAGNLRKPHAKRALFS